MSLIAFGCLLYGSSCKEIVYMSDSALGHYLDNYADGMKLNDFKEQNQHKIDLYDREANSVQICQVLRKIKNSSTSMAKRALWLEALSTKSLKVEEKEFYKKFLSENIDDFKSMSFASLVSEEFTKFPLILVKMEQDNETAQMRVYEFRIKNGVIMHRFKVLDDLSGVVFFGSDQTAKKAYLNYERDIEGITLHLKRKRDRQIVETLPVEQISLVSSYRVVKPIDIDCNDKEENRKLKPGEVVQLKSYQNGKYIFYNNGEECSAWEKWWNKGVEKE